MAATIVGGVGSLRGAALAGLMLGVAESVALNFVDTQWAEAWHLRDRASQMIAYLTNLAALAAIFGILAATLNVAVGYAGIFSVAHAVFFGLGAYAGAQIALVLVPDALLAMLVAGLVAGVLSLCLALPALRVRGEYFVAASLGLQMMATTLFSEWKSVTGGIGGLTGIPRPHLFGVEVGTLPLALAALALILVLLISGSTLFALRSLIWLRGRNRERTPEQAYKQLRATNVLSFPIAVFCTAWSISLLPYGD
eukprot:gene48065-58878_t